MKDRVRVQLFGSFRLVKGEASLGEGTMRSNKLTKLLAYFIINRDVPQTNQRLAELFWEDNSRNPAGALKNLMYRLRNELRALGNESYIITLPGAYQWNPEIEIESDYEQFEDCIRRLHAAEEDEEKKHICREALACCQGRVSPVIAEEFWVLSKVMWYRSMYMDTVKQLCEILEREQSWGEMEIVSSQALRVDPLDEDINCWLIKSQQGQGKMSLRRSSMKRRSTCFTKILGSGIPKSWNMRSGRLRQNRRGASRRCRDSWRRSRSPAIQGACFSAIIRSSARFS